MRTCISQRPSIKEASLRPRLVIGTLSYGSRLKNPDDPAAGTEQQTSAEIQMADDESRVNRTDAALAGYHSAISMAQRVNDDTRESLALAHLADLQEKTGDVRSAADSYQRGLALDSKSADPARRSTPTGLTTDSSCAGMDCPTTWSTRVCCTQSSCLGVPEARILKP